MLVTRLTSKTKVLILDEPFNHLDKNCVNDLKELFSELVGRGLSLILVSHLDVDFENVSEKKVQL